MPLNGGHVRFDGRPVVVGGKRSKPGGVAVVWQDLALCDNLDVAANLLLGSGVPTHDVLRHPDAYRSGDDP
jgi:ABC-type sugar transport system ATPase subunit